MNTIHTLQESRLVAARGFSRMSVIRVGRTASSGAAAQGSSRRHSMRNSWNVSAAGEFPRFAAQIDGWTTDGVSVVPGKAVQDSATRYARVVRPFRSGMRTAGTGGVWITCPQSTAGHTRTSGRRQGARVTGSGAVAVGALRAGVSAPVTWVRSSDQEAEQRETEKARRGSALDRETEKARRGSALDRETEKVRRGSALDRETEKVRRGSALDREKENSGEVRIDNGEAVCDSGPRPNGNISMIAGNT